MLVRQITLSPPCPTHLTPFLPYACSLLRAPKKLIPFRIKRIEPLFPKHRGWGIPDDSAGHRAWEVGNDVPRTQPTGHASRPSIAKVLPTASPLRPPFPQYNSPCTHHRFASSLFSTTSALLFPQLLSFHNHLRCPIVFSPRRKFPLRLKTERQVTSFRINAFAIPAGGVSASSVPSVVKPPQSPNATPSDDAASVSGVRPSTVNCEPCSARSPLFTTPVFPHRRPRGLS